MTITPAEITRLRELLAKQTPGPWKFNDYDHGGGRIFFESGDTRTLVADFFQEGDRELFKAVNAALPALLDAAEQHVCAPS